MPALAARGPAARQPGVGLAAPLLLERDGRVQRSGQRRFPTLGTTWLNLCFPLAFLQSALERCVPRVAELSVAEHEAGVRPLWVMGAAMAFRREAWDAVGPFDTRYFMYFEETAWQERMHAAGWRVELAAQARVRHLHRGGAAGMIAPPLRYLDSARIYLGDRGHRDLTIRATLASALLLSWLTLLALRPFARWMPARGELVAASLAPERRALAHVLRGRPLPRPDAAQPNART